MRMRNKKNLVPRMERCAAVQVLEPAAMRGRWASLCPDCTEVQAEIGCGKGKFTAGVAQANPSSLIVALEKVPNAMVTAMELVCREEIPNVRFIDTDAANLLDIFAPGELSAIYINFPDPWPRQKEAKRRLTAPQFLALYQTALADGGRIEYKTDQPWLFDWTVQRLEEAGFAVEEMSRNLHADGVRGIMTNYEARFHAEGTPIHRCVAVKAPARLDRPA